MSNDLSFSSLSIPAAQKANLESIGYREMTPIQAAALPSALRGLDLVAQAKTGSGKTAVFGISLLNRLKPLDVRVQALVICPTRELSVQVTEEIRKLARAIPNVRLLTICGGQPFPPQKQSLKQGVHIVVGTPGRIKEHLEKATLVLDRVNTLVLDEADRMLEMGFIRDIEAIMKHVPASRQTLLFSATYPENILDLSARIQRNPVRVNVESQHSAAEIDQHFYACTKESRLATLVTLLFRFKPASTIVFCNTIQVVRDVSAYLTNQGFSAKAIHGELEQREREQILVQFKHQSITVLVATDVAARGLDIEGLPAVINFELPPDPEIYIHRIGRTGRAGRAGKALSLFTEHERHKVEAIGTFQKRAMSVENIERIGKMDRVAIKPAMVTLSIAGGRRDKVRAGEILGALTGTTGVPGTAVGKIDILDFVSYVAVDRDLADKALRQLESNKIKGRRYKVGQL